ncbi:MAG: DUF3299 domain-containing protein [Marinobacter sp.]
MAYRLLLLTLVLLISAQPSLARAEPREIGWQDLVPIGWPDRDPLDGRDISLMDDDDPETQQLYSVLREYLDNAPVVPSLDGQNVIIPGFVVPVSFKAGTREIREFLLVPFYGACIHVPPPASNQIILVDGEQASSQFPEQPDAPVLVTGRLSVNHVESELAVSSYRLDASRITAYP